MYVLEAFPRRAGRSARRSKASVVVERLIGRHSGGTPPEEPNGGATAVAVRSGCWRVARREGLDPPLVDLVELLVDVLIDGFSLDRPVIGVRSPGGRLALDRFPDTLVRLGSSGLVALVHAGQYPARRGINLLIALTL